MQGKNRKDLVCVFREYLKGRGLSFTAQRKAVLEQILNGASHFDVETLVDDLRRANASVSRATVYRTVAQLEKAKLIRKMDFDESHAHFEIISKENHHEHLICERCGTIVEFSDPRLERRIRRMASQHAMEMTKHFVQIIGICEACRE